MIAKGLTLDSAYKLVTTWSHGAAVHIQRTVPTTEAWCKQVDKDITDMVGHMTRTVLNETQKKLIFLRIGEGGLGCGSAQDRGAAAWVGAWEGDFHMRRRAMPSPHIASWYRGGPSGRRRVKGSARGWGRSRTAR